MRVDHAARFFLAVKDTSLAIPDISAETLIPPASVDQSQVVSSVLGLFDQVLTLRTTQNIVKSEGQQVVIFPVNFRQGNIRPHNVHSQ